MPASTTSPAPQPSSALRKLSIGLAAVLLLLVALYFVISSSAFVKGVILPRVSKSLNAQISAGDASLSPFSQLVLNQVKVQTTGTEPLLTAETIRVRYGLFSILRGKYEVNELTLLSPTIQLVTEPTGVSNLDPLTQGTGQPTSSSSESSQVPQLALKNLSIKEGTVRTIAKAKDGSVKTVELAHLNLSVDRFENGQSGKLSVGTNLRLDNQVPAGNPGTNDLLTGQLDGNFDFKAAPNLLPQSVNGNAVLALANGQGAYADLTGLTAQLQADMTPSEIRQLTLRFDRTGQSLGRIQASGPLDLVKTEGRVKLEVQSIDRQVLNLVGASRGWDFADSKINATNFLDLAQAGKFIGAKGHLSGRDVSVRQPGQSMPPMNIEADYEVSLDLEKQAAVVKSLALTGQQRGKDFLRGSLDRPMTLTWAPNARGFAESTFQLALIQLDLQDWRSILGTNVPTGLLDLQINVVARQDGKELQTKSTASIQNLSAQWSTNHIEGATLSAAVEAVLSDFRNLRVERYNVELREKAQSVLRAYGSVSYELGKGGISLQANADIDLPTLLHQLPPGTWRASKGALRLSSSVTNKDRKYSCTGNLTLSDFTGGLGDYAFQDFKSALDYNVDYEGSAVQIHSASLTLSQGYRTAGTLTVNGDYDLNKGSSHLTFNAVDLNQNLLGPVLRPSLSEGQQLTSISVGGSGSVSYDPAGEASLKGNLVATNWVVTAGQSNLVTLGAQVQVDGSMRQQVVDLRQFLLKLAPTDRAKNELNLTAHLDLGRTNPTPSQIMLRAESLDLTPYYAMFSGKQTASAKPSTKTASAPAATASSNEEPAPITLPVQKLTADCKMDRLFLGELAITNLQTMVTVDGSQVNVRPLDLLVNGGPMTGNVALNLGVPGYTYDVSMKMDRVPLEPLSNTFTTNAPGTYKGQLSGQAQFKGAGLTGRSLQKSLAGSVSLTLTNMNYELVGAKVKRLIEPIATVLRVPELTQTPLNWIATRIDLGKGQIDLQEFAVESQAFHAESHGAIPIADILTNSPVNLPVNLSLRRSLADKAHLLPENTPTNAVYAPLPAFVTLAGTLGDLKTEINKMVVAGLAARSIGGIVPVGDKAGNIIQGIGGILSGQSSAPASTNAPARTNAASPANIVQDITTLFNQSKSKSRPNTNAPATPKKPAGK